MIGVLADDLTGANDVGSMFAKHGFLTKAFLGCEHVGYHGRDADVTIVDTHSRGVEPRVAYDKSRAASRCLADLGCKPIYRKIDSTFRGNIGAEVEGSLEELGVGSTVLVPAVPRYGRTTRDGVLYLHGQRLEDSPLARDPVNPMSESYLPDLLQKQTDREVGLIRLDAVRNGSTGLAAALEDASREAVLIVVDAETEEDLRAIASAVSGYDLICGAGGLAGELAQIWKPADPQPREHSLPPSRGAGTLIVAGSVTPVTRAQNEHAAHHGVDVMTVEATRVLADSREASTEIQSLSKAIAASLSGGRTTLLCTPAEPEAVSATLQAAREQGLSPATASRRISAALAEVTQAAIEAAQTNRLIIAGGDTAAAICSRLGVVGTVILEEIQPGVPASLSLGREGLALILKSGGFGTEDFYSKALAHLRG